MQDVGFEVRHEENLREHYALTTAAWSDNLDAHWDEAVAEVGLGTARVWRLYLAGVRLAFERNRIQLHQVLGWRGGGKGFPLRPGWEGGVFPPGVPAGGEPPAPGDGDGVGEAPAVGL